MKRVDHYILKENTPPERVETAHKKRKDTTRITRDVLGNTSLPVLYRSFSSYSGFCITFSCVSLMVYYIVFLDIYSYLSSIPLKYLFIHLFSLILLSVLHYYEMSASHTSNLVQVLLLWRKTLIFVFLEKYFNLINDFSTKIFYCLLPSQFNFLFNMFAFSIILTK